MGIYREFFKFAAKAGSLEGYIYERKRLEPLADWVNNIDRMFHQLPQEVRQDTREEYLAVLGKVLQYGEGTLKPDIKARLESMVAGLGPS